MRMFIRRYNRYIRKIGIKHSNKNLMKFIKFIPQKKWDDKKKEERLVTCFECGKPEHIKIDCPSLVKRKGKQPLYNMKIKNAKDSIAYIA